MQDIVERFHLFMALAFVLVEEMNNGGTWRPSAALATQCSYFLAAELVIGALLSFHVQAQSRSIIHLRRPYAATFGDEPCQ